MDLVDGRREEAAAEIASSDVVDPAAILRAFHRSSELALLDPGDRELVWVEELLDVMDCAGWTWNDLDLDGLAAALFDGLCWTIVRAPPEPARVARVLASFLTFAGREYGAPHAVECCRYLRSRRAVVEIGKWVVPVVESQR